MNESITREEAEERLSGAINIEFTLNMLFPPKPTFKDGEVIAVHGEEDCAWVFRKFIKMTDDDFYRCELENEPRHAFDWRMARSQTDEEKGK